VDASWCMRRSEDMRSGAPIQHCSSRSNRSTAAAQFKPLRNSTEGKNRRSRALARSWVKELGRRDAEGELVELGKSSLKEVKLLSRPRELVFSSPPTG
jgi:hypothetical protein